MDECYVQFMNAFMTEWMIGWNDEWINQIIEKCVGDDRLRYKHESLTHQSL